MNDGWPSPKHEHPPVADLSPRGTVRHVPLEPHRYTDRITATSDIFVLAHVGIPRVEPTGWWLDIAGLVEKPCRLSLNDLHRMPKKEIESFHQCAGFPMNPRVATRRYANALWAGVDLADLLAEVGIAPEARYLWSFGVDRGTFHDVELDGYVKDIPIDRLKSGYVLLAYELNGQMLSYEHGAPLRLVVPGFYGTNWVKWLYRLELADERPKGPFTTRYYNDVQEPTDGSPAYSTPVWAIAPEAVIVSPEENARIAAGSIEVWGWAWAEAGLQKVQISFDNGVSWAEAVVEDGSRWSWKRFTYRWMPQRSGIQTIMARASDRNGAIQPLLNRRNSVHSLTVEATRSTL